MQHNCLKAQLLNSESGMKFQQKLENMAQKQHNTFEQIRNWVRAEYLMLQSLVLASKEHERCDARKANAKKKLGSNLALIEKIVHGNFSFSLMFMNIDAQIKKREALVRESRQLERDLDNWDEIKTYITIYLTEIAIPDYVRRANIFYA